MVKKEGRTGGMSGPVAFVWLAEETYPRFLQVIADRHRFADTFEGWREIAQRQFDDFRARGFNLVKVTVDPDEMKTWCVVHGCAVDRHGRSAYAAFKLQEDYGSDAH